MTSFYYNYQNPSVCCFLVQTRAIFCKPQRDSLNFIPLWSKRLEVMSEVPAMFLDEAKEKFV